jgi:hypothetical protein
VDIASSTFSLKAEIGTHRSFNKNVVVLECEKSIISFGDICQKFLPEKSLLENEQASVFI